MNERIYKNLSDYEGNSKHSIERVKERAGLSRKRAVKMIDLARTRGIHSDECRWSADKKFLEKNSNAEAVAVAFNGYCFILDRNTQNCITMYSLPRSFGKKKAYYKTRIRMKYNNVLELAA